MRVTILGKHWNLRFVRMTDDGYCDHPDTPNKEIRINRRLKGRIKLETILHELLHTGDFDKDERWVGQLAHDASVILDKLGYSDD